MFFQAFFKFFRIPSQKIRLIVGISGPDEEVAVYKRPSIYSIEEKTMQMLGMKGVDRVINSPLVITNAFVEEHGIDLVVAGDDYDDLNKIRKYYKDPYERGIFKTFKRTPSIYFDLDKARCQSSRKDYR